MRAAGQYDVKDSSDSGGNHGHLSKVSPTHATKKVLSANQTRMAKIASKLEQQVLTPQREESRSHAAASGGDSIGGETTTSVKDHGSRSKPRARHIVGGSGAPLANGNSESVGISSPSSSAARSERRSSVSLTEIRKMMLTPKENEPNIGATSNKSMNKRSPASVVNRRALAKERMAKRWKLVRDNVVSPRNRSAAAKANSLTMDADGAGPEVSRDEISTSQAATATEPDIQRTAPPHHQPVAGRKGSIIDQRSQAAATTESSTESSTTKSTHGEPGLHHSTSFRRGTMFGTYTQREVNALRERDAGMASGKDSSTLPGKASTVPLPHGIRRLQSVRVQGSVSEKDEHHAPADEEDRLIVGKPSLKTTKSWAVRGVIPASRRRVSQAAFAGTTPSSMRRLRSASFTKPENRQTRKEKEAGWARTDRRPQPKPERKPPTRGSGSHNSPAILSSREAILEHIVHAVSSGRTLWGKEVSRLDDLFDAIDADRTGRINISELRRAFIRLDVMGKSGPGKIASRANKGVEDLLMSMDTGGDGVVDREEFMRALTPFGLKRGRSRSKNKSTKIPASPPPNQSGQGLMAVNVESFETKQARLMHLSSSRDGDNGYSSGKISSLEKELARLKMTFAKKEREMRKTIEELKGLNESGETEAAIKTKDEELRKMRKRLSQAETVARMSSEAKKMEFMSAERVLQERVDALQEERVQDAKAREVLEALVHEAGRNMSKIEEEHKVEIALFRSEQSDMFKEREEREKDRHAWEVERADFVRQISIEQSKARDLAEQVSREEGRCKDLIRKQEHLNAKRLDELHALKEAMERMETSAKESYVKQLKEAESRFEAERAAWRVGMDQMDETNRKELKQEKLSWEKIAREKTEAAIQTARVEASEAARKAAWSEAKLALEHESKSVSDEIDRVREEAEKARADAEERYQRSIQILKNKQASALAALQLVCLLCALFIV